MNRRTLILTGRALKGRFIRTLLTIGGVAATSMLVIVLFATHRSLTTSVNSYIKQPDIDLWITPIGTDNLIRTSGQLPPELDEEILEKAGIARIDPLLRSFVSAQPHDQGTVENGNDKKLTLLAIGYKAPDGLGRPPEISAGRAPSERSEVALDRGAAHLLGVQQGDSLLINFETFHVSGLTRGTNLLATQFVFINIEYLWEKHIRSGRASILAAQLQPGTDPESTINILVDYYPELDFFDSQTFVENNLREIASGLVPILGLIAVLGISIATVLVVLLIQGLVEERRYDIAVLFALGNSAGIIGTGLVIRAALLVGAGTILGGLISAGLVEVLDQFAPHIELNYVLLHFIIVLSIFLPAGILAAVVPLLRLRRIDPLEAFRA